MNPVHLGGIRSITIYARQFFPAVSKVVMGPSNNPTKTNHPRPLRISSLNRGPAVKHFLSQSFHPPKKPTEKSNQTHWLQTWRFHTGLRPCGIGEVFGEQP